jgi:hypothetical protein
MEKKVLGRKEKITLPELGLNLVGAKIDTGAYTSSLHAEEIRIDKMYRPRTPGETEGKQNAGTGETKLIETPRRGPSKRLRFTAWAR